jgi:flagellar motor switch protein FliN/FliY
VLATGGLLVPLTDADGAVNALVALAIEVQIGGTDVVASNSRAGGGPAPAGGGRHSSEPALPAGQAIPAGFAPLTPGPRGTPVVRGGLELLHDVEMEVTAELGRTRMCVRDLLAMAPGAVIELDRVAGGPTDLLVNGRLIARGEVDVIDENFGIRLTDIVP